MTDPLWEVFPPTEAQVATAYLRIADIYRRSALPHLAVDYYELVANRFAHLRARSRRARLGAARCSVALGAIGAARRRLRSLVRDPETPAPLLCHAALRLIALAPDPATLLRRLERRLPVARFTRWARLAAQIQCGPRMSSCSGSKKKMPATKS